jgi:hypothetical protein
MEMAMLMSGALLRKLDQQGRPVAWAHGSGTGGLLRLTIALLVIAALVLTLERRGLQWLWPALSGLFGGALT